jgi:hypothetical protein
MSQQDDPLQRLIGPLSALNQSLSMGGAMKPEDLWPNWKDGGPVTLVDNQGVARSFTLGQLLAGLALHDIAALPASVMLRLIKERTPDVTAD